MSAYFHIATMRDYAEFPTIKIIFHGIPEHVIASNLPAVMQPKGHLHNEYSQNADQEPDDSVEFRVQVVKFYKNFRVHFFLNRPSMV